MRPHYIDQGAFLCRKIRHGDVRYFCETVCQESRRILPELRRPKNYKGETIMIFAQSTDLRSKNTALPRMPHQLKHGVLRANKSYAPLLSKIIRAKALRQKFFKCIASCKIVLLRKQNHKRFRAAKLAYYLTAHSARRTKS